MRVTCQSCRFNFKLDSTAVKASGTLVRCSKCHTLFRVYPPEMVRYRKHTRVKTQNLISYFAVNKHHRLIAHGLGIALDISQGGILLETPCSIESSYLVLTAVDKLKNIIEVQGRLIYSKKTTRSTFLCGIEFIGNDERVRSTRRDWHLDREQFRYEMRMTAVGVDELVLHVEASLHRL